MERESSSTGVIIGILVVIVILIVAWIAYGQGFFGGRAAAPADNNRSIDVNVDLPGNTGGSGGTGGNTTGGTGGTQ